MRVARYVVAYGILAVFCFLLYRAVGTMDDWRYWTLVLLAILYGAAMSWASQE